LVHLASFLFFILLVLQNVNELPSSPLLRGGKGNNLFLLTKTFSGFILNYFQDRFFSHLSFKPLLSLTPLFQNPMNFAVKAGAKVIKVFCPANKLTK
jgi:hypothetical protein